MEKFLCEFFFNDRKLAAVCQFSQRYFAWKLDLYFEYYVYILLSSPKENLHMQEIAHSFLTL